MRGLQGQICNVLLLDYSIPTHNTTKVFPFFVTGAPKNKNLENKKNYRARPLRSCLLQANYECIQNNSFHPAARVCSAVGNQRPSNSRLVNTAN